MKLISLKCTMQWHLIYSQWDTMPSMYRTFHHLGGKPCANKAVTPYICLCLALDNH